MRSNTMTFFEFIKRCLQIEAVRTEPDPKPTIDKVLREKEYHGKRNAGSADL